MTDAACRDTPFAGPPSGIDAAQFIRRRTFYNFYTLRLLSTSATTKHTSLLILAMSCSVKMPAQVKFRHSGIAAHRHPTCHRANDARGIQGAMVNRMRVPQGSVAA